MTLPDHHPFPENWSEIQERATQWFAELQSRIIAQFEALEHQGAGCFDPSSTQAGTFEKKPWKRTDHTGSDGGGGTMAMLRGRIFEKCGVHVSTVHGEFAPEFSGQIPGTDKNPRFWAAGISLIAHPWNPHIPTVHMNTRLVATSKPWFGGGADLTPMLASRRTQDDPDTVLFHDAMQKACAHLPAQDYVKYKEWCEKYFYLPHRKEQRGIGGIFFDYRWEDFDQDFKLVQHVGEQFLSAYTQIVENNWEKSWTPEERIAQQTQRGRYVEFNLLYDRGTLFGLKTGGNVDSILSSMPPSVVWP